MSFSILTTIDKDKKIWNSLINKLRPDIRDVHFLPEYGEIYKETFNYEPFLAIYEDRDDFILQPFVKRSLHPLPFLKVGDLDSKYFDVMSPYGYGGAIFSTTNVKKKYSLLKDFNSNLIDYFKKQHVVSEFTSFHPILENHNVYFRLKDFRIAKNKKIVYIDLSLKEENIWKAIRKGHKSSIKFAQKNGVFVKKVAHTKKNFETLNNLYSNTMIRKKASDRWHFPKIYFKNCLKFLSAKRVSLFFSFINKQPITACLLLHDFDTVYFHFNGWDYNYRKLCANHLMLYHITLWAKKRGFLYFHLGGGVNSVDSDSLFRFKSGFSKKYKFLYSYSRIHDYYTYDQLKTLKIKYETDNNLVISDPKFFPFYRRE